MACGRVGGTGSMWVWGSEGDLSLSSRCRPNLAPSLFVRGHRSGGSDSLVRCPAPRAPARRIRRREGSRGHVFVGQDLDLAPVFGHRSLCVDLALLVVRFRARIVSLASGTPRNRGQLSSMFRSQTGPCRAVRWQRSSVRSRPVPRRTRPWRRRTSKKPGPLGGS